MPKRSTRGKKKGHNKKGQNPTKQPPSTLQERENKFSYSIKVIAALVGGIIALIGGTAAYLEILNPPLSVSIGQNTPKIFDAYFTFTNEGYLFTLYDATARVSTDRIEIPNATIRDITMEVPMSKLGNITPRNHSTFPLSKVVDFEDWEKGSICLVVDFTIKLFGGVKKLSKTQTFGFYAEKKGRINEWIQRPCNQLQSS